MILPFGITGSRVRGVIVICEIPKLLVSEAYKTNEDVVVQAHNTCAEVKLISQKAALVGVELFEGTEI